MSQPPQQASSQGQIARRVVSHPVANLKRSAASTSAAAQKSPAPANKLSSLVPSKKGHRIVTSNPMVRASGTNPMVRLSGTKSNRGEKAENSGMKQNGVSEDLFNLMGKALTEFPWYHGLMPGQDCQELLVNDGDFVVRRSKKDTTSLFCISAKKGNEYKHMPLQYKDGKWLLAKYSCGTMKELIDQLLADAQPIGKTGGVLKNGIPRPEYYLLHENITTNKLLGSGAFGEVYNGTLRLKDGTEVKVAVKKVKGQVTQLQQGKFIKEAMIMRKLLHPNCVRLYGVAAQENPIMIVLEFAGGGSLITYFKKNPDCKEEQLLSFLRDAARGMCYLAACQVIHRDLKARNCLLNDENVLKISDFGLSVSDTPELKLTQLKSVPIRWLSPETLRNGVFNAKTDVWSYGVLTWEIFAKCKTAPYPYDTNAQAKEKILNHPRPLEPPPGAPPMVHAVMTACLVRDPPKRADFVTVLKMVAPGETPPTGN